MDARFINAFTDPAQVNILGYVVYPFCLKYRVRLHAIGSPFVQEADFTATQLLAAIKTCAELPIDDVTGKDKAILIQWQRDSDLFIKTAKDFRGYMLETHWPKFWETDQSKRAAGTGMPWVLNIVANLVANGIDEKRAWEMPECQAIWMSTAFSGLKGVDVNLMTTEEEEAMAAFTTSQG
ncbi:MAG: hypothetical protein RIR91_366 [Verrucomicrobiota bacterium]|jgi:hypothetical protein